MQVVFKHIKSLLFSNDCVIIPNFGGLVSNPKSARLNTLSQRLSPPYKAVGFNSRLSSNDGLLAHEISIKENIDYDQAIDLINECVASIKEQLSVSGKFSLSDIGEFYNDINGNLRFKQNTKFSIDHNFFGLESIQLSPLKKEMVQREDTLVTIPVETAPTERTPTAQSTVVSINSSDDRASQPFPWKRLAVAACVLPFLLYIFWVSTYSTIFGSNDQFQYSDLNPFTKKVCTTFSPRIEEATLFANPKNVSSLELAAELGNKTFIQHSFLERSDKELHGKSVLTIQLKNFEAIAFTTDVSGDKNLFAPRGEKGFFIVTGCFEFYENATKYISRLRNEGFDAQIVDQKNGLFRISASTAKSRKKALTQLQRVKSSGYSDAWVLSKQ